ncbi:MAG: (Fe-S)-binding protein [Candidatus Hydrothermarchaeota archaeon]
MNAMKGYAGLKLKLSDEMSWETFACAQCGYCVPVCCMYDLDKWESSTPKGKLFFLKNVLNKKAKFDDKMVERIYQCTGCGYCHEVCQVNIPTIELWEELRSELVRLKLGPMPNHLRIKDAAKDKHNPYNEDPAKRGAWMPDNIKINENSSVLYFAGCTASYRMLDLAKSTAKVFHAAGMDFNFLAANEWCCGSPFLRTGQLDIAYDLITQNINEFKNRGIETIVASCAGCYRTLYLDYPRWADNFGLDFDVEVKHTSQYILELIEEGRVNLKDPIDMKVTYHDPCHMARHLGIYDEPREILKAIPSLELVEMEKNRELARCCGAGGGMRAQFGEMAMELAKIRAEDAISVDAKLIASCCPFCRLNLSDGVKKTGSDIKVRDVSEIVLESMGLS